MSRQHRIQFPNAIYHVTSRGNRRQDIVHDDQDRDQFWERLGNAVRRFGWDLFAASLMTNHFHLFFRTPEPNLSRGMQWLLGGYATWWNTTSLSLPRSPRPRMVGFSARQVLSLTFVG